MAEAADGQHEVRPGDLVDALADLARQMQQEVGTEDTLEKVVQAAIAMIPGAQEASVSVVGDRRKIESWAASSDLPRTVDALRSEVGEGPCLDAAFDAEAVDVPDMANEQRWSHFAQRAAEAGAARSRRQHRRNLGALRPLLLHAALNAETPSGNSPAAGGGGRRSHIVLEDGTVVGSISTAFENAASGLIGQLSVTLPSACAALVEQHLEHFAVEFRNWLLRTAHEQHSPATGA